MPKSLTGFTGLGITGIIATLLASPDILGLLPAKYVAIANTISAVFVAFGIRRRLPSGPTT